MRLSAAGLVFAITGLSCFFLPAGVSAAEVDNGTIVPAAVDAAPQPLAVPSVTQSPLPPRFVDPVVGVDREPVGKLPEPTPAVQTPAAAPQPTEQAAPPTGDDAAVSVPDVLDPAPPAAADKPVLDRPADSDKPADNPQPSSATAPEAPPALKDFIKTAAEKLAGASAKGGHSAELTKERTAIAAFYAERDYAPLWLDDGKPTPAAKAALARLALADADGLDLRGFITPVFEGGDEQLAAAEVALSAEVVAYGRQATGSRIDPRTISPLIGAKPELVEPGAVLAAVSAAGRDAGQVLEDFNPPQPGYRALRDKLAELRRIAVPSASVNIPAGPELKVGMRDPRVSLVRARFGLDAAASSPEDLIYDTKIAAAVADFQKATGLPPSGVLSRRTLAALRGGEPSRLENEIIANMERWRWMPRDLGDSRIEVDIPDFSVTVIRDGEVVARNKVVVGKTATPTPLFSNTMQFLIVNPYWNVPQSIIRKEMLPRLGQDPDYLRRLGYEVSYRHGQITVRQPPGERNALGRIKFMFPNDYSVYLHDTPSRALFGAAQRAFSHGCVRVDQPFAFAEAVLGRDNGWTAERVKHLIGGRERYVYLPKPLPIHIEYFTAFVDETGELRLRDDIYGYSARVKTALGLAN